MTTAPRDEKPEGGSTDASVDTNRPASGEQPQTRYPTGEEQAAENVANEPAG